MRILKAVLSSVGFVLVLVGVAGFLMPFILVSAFKDDTSIELPLAMVEDVAVSATGDVYFALMHAGRVQRYSASGRFLGSFGVHSAGGVFCIVINDGALQVHVARRDVTDLHDLSGRLLRENVSPDTGIKYFPCRGDLQVAGVSCDWRSVRVRYTDNRPPLTIERRFWHLFALHPFQSLLIFVVGSLLVSGARERVLRSMGIGRK